MGSWALLRDVLLALHLAVGSLGLVLGPAALWRSRAGPAVAAAVGPAYIFSVLAVSLTAFGLIALDWSQLWWLAILAAFSSGLAVVALVAPRLRFRGWERACAHGEGGSYIALVTALFVVSVDGPAAVAAWILPTLAGLPLIEVRAARLRARETAERGRLLERSSRRREPVVEAAHERRFRR